MTPDFALLLHGGLPGLPADFVLADLGGLLDYHSAIAVLLLVIGLGTLVAEVFIPSGGAITMVALAALGGALVFAWQAWWETYPNVFWSFLAATVMLVPMVFIAALTILPRTSVGRRILLEAPDPAELTPYSRDDEHFARLVGRYGKTLTMLNPGGLVLVEGERIHAESQGMLIDAGEEIQVIGRKVNRVVVRLARRPAEETTPAPSEPAADEALSPRRDDDKLDFDFPQS